MPATNRHQLRNRAYLREYLCSSLSRGPREFYAALREAVKANKGGIAGLSRRTGLTRTGLSKALSASGNPSYDTISRVLDTLGLELELAPLSGAEGREIVIPGSKKGAGIDKNGAAIDKPGKAKDETPRPSEEWILPGSAKGMTYFMADDFNDPLPEFADYM